MFPANFDYHRASSVEEALSLLAGNPGAKLLAGGHSLLPLLKQRLAEPSALIDIGRIAELSGIARSGATIRIGALTRHAALAASEVLARDCPLLAEAAAKVADPQVRNRGTIGGNIAHADPASDLPAVLVALGATVHLRGPGGARSVAAADFFVDLLTSDVRDGEIVTAVEVPVLAHGTGTCYAKVEHPASGYAVCGAAAVISLDADGRATGGALAFNGVAATPANASAVVAALQGRIPDDAAIAGAIDQHLAIADPLGDIHATGEYRVQLAKVYGRRALERARDRARS